MNDVEQIRSFPFEIEIEIHILLVLYKYTSFLWQNSAKINVIANCTTVELVFIDMNVKCMQVILNVEVIKYYTWRKQHFTMLYLTTQISCLFLWQKSSLEKLLY